MALLGEQAPSGSFVSMEMPFCAYPEYDMRVADVGYISRERWAQTDPDGNLQGAPDITIEILSPSNTAREMREKCVLCLTHGSKQFWIVDEKNRRVHINYDDKSSQSFAPGDEIPMDLLSPGKILAVSRIFEA
ncbi:MAG: Uma2 family endonuclease [Bryobacteraceae bacterium]|nr:Uma2 family endonuclease [Bryobacteraceae bacterium]